MNLSLSSLAQLGKNVLVIRFWKTLLTCQVKHANLFAFVTLFSYSDFHPWGISWSLNQNYLNVHPDLLRQNIIQLHLLLWLVSVCTLPLALESRDRGLNHKTMCMNSEQILSNGKKVRHYDVHSLYGWSQTQPTYEWVHITWPGADDKRKNIPALQWLYSLIILRKENTDMTSCSPAAHYWTWLAKEASWWPGPPSRPVENGLDIGWETTLQAGTSYINL